MAYTAADVKTLRERTGAGMMDCKKALDETGGDLESSVDVLRAKGLAAAVKKSSRTAAEGLVGVAVSGLNGVAVEVNSETDFVAKNDQFQDFVRNTTQVALDTAAVDVDVLKDAAYPGGGTVSEKLTNNVATIGENQQLRRLKHVSVTSGIVVPYMHNAAATNLGKIGVLVALESTGDQDKLQALGRQIAMHVAAAKPDALRIEDVDQAKASGKPDAIIEKMVDGRLRKYYEEVVLLEQVFVVDGETKVAKVVENAAKDVGAPVALTGFVRFALGEGIEKAEGDDFATEVAKMAH